MNKIKLGLLLIAISLSFFKANAAEQNPLTGFVNAARSQIGTTVRYDPTYLTLSYPNGDVPIDGGVCTDVVIRALRSSLNMDLQRGGRQKAGKSGNSLDMESMTG